MRGGALVTGLHEAGKLGKGALDEGMLGGGDGGDDKSGKGFLVEKRVYGGSLE